MLTRREFLRLSAVAGAGLFIPWNGIFQQLPTVLASPPITKYVDPLPIPSAMPQAGSNYYEIRLTQFPQKLHRDLAPTMVWGYNGTFPARTFEVRRGVPITVKWINNLPTTHLLQTAIDPTIPDPSMSGKLPDVRIVPHLHGGFTLPQFDGHPDAWWTPGLTKTGPTYVTDTYAYHNDQQATTLWYHDHGMGITRLNVYAGLAGFYLIRDAVEDGLNIPKGSYEVPIVIQDRMFNADGSLFYPNIGITTYHPIWVPEFFGDTPVVNGKAYPFLEVEPRSYRFRFLNGSQARFYNLWFDAAGGAVPFYQIGTDGGFLGAPVQLNRLLIAPGERADVLFDFSALPNGTVLTLMNNAKAPFPGGRGGMIPQIMQFRVTKPLMGKDTTIPPANLNLPPITHLSPQGAYTRDIVLKENMDPLSGEPVEVLLNGKHFHDPVTEKPKAGSTEIWQFINLTEDAHPMHIHLVQFQILNRQPLNVEAYTAAWLAGQKPVLDHYLSGPAIPPDSNEAGWKDTAKAYPGQVLRVIAKFDLPSGKIQLPKGIKSPQYVYHCHILEHEDNEMMRPYEVN